jgi:hypothetical protein
VSFVKIDRVMCVSVGWQSSGVPYITATQTATPFEGVVRPWELTCNEGGQRRRLKLSDHDGPQLLRLDQVDAVVRLHVLFILEVRGLPSSRLTAVGRWGQAA